jgi:hypothetical protein
MTATAEPVATGPASGSPRCATGPKPSADQLLTHLGGAAPTVRRDHAGSMLGWLSCWERAVAVALGKGKFNAESGAAATAGSSAGA